MAACKRFGNAVDRLEQAKYTPEEIPAVLAEPDLQGRSWVVEEN